MPPPLPSQADNQPAIAPESDAPLDPRRAPDVLFALAQAAKRDPHPDPLKPVGRSSFVIWLAILATLALVFSPARHSLHIPELRVEVMTALHNLFGSNLSPAHILHKLRHNTDRLEILAVMGFAAGTLVFALYYLAVYLVAMNARRLAGKTATAIHAGARRTGAWIEARRAGRKGSARTVFERTTPAGPEPHLQ
jgi:hypothetical protein